MTEPITASALGLDLSSRFLATATVVASPAAGSETIIASLTVPGDPTIVSRVMLLAWAAFTVGTSGVSANLKIRQTDASGTTIAATGATTATATDLEQLVAMGRDTAAVIPGQIYVATLLVGSGAAESTVSGVFLGAVLI